MKKFIEFYNGKAKKYAMTIAQAIVLLVIASVAIAGLTPVLTRKLPNLATASTIKHPKGWYESYNAPDDPHVRFCRTCCIADGVCKPDGSYNKNPDPNTPPSAWPAGPVYVADAMPPECIGNPKCNPYVEDPINDLDPFDRYCKPNGTCLPPRHCEGPCRFNPPKGVSKYVVYAIGGGGGSGSAVAKNSDETDKNIDYNDPRNSYTKLVGGRNNREINNTYDTSSLPVGADVNLNTLPGHRDIVSAHFIDMNRKFTSTNYTPGDFVNDRFNRDSEYPNRLAGSLNPKCATGILYTVGDQSRNFHIYPTEDADSRLAKDVSDKQIKRILKEHGKRETYKIGNIEFPYYERYYLFTRQLGVYNYNQNPVYSLMPEWIKVKDDDLKYRDRSSDEIFDLSASTYCNNCLSDNPQDGCFKTDSNGNIKDKDHNVCHINYYMPGGACKNGNYITPITSKFKTAAAVACSGNGGKGGDAVAVLKAGVDEPCDWMKPKGCVFDQENYLENRKILPKDISYNESCDNYPGTTDEPPSGTTSVVLGQYCRATGEYDYWCDRYDDDDKCIACAYQFNDVYYNMICNFKTYTTGYVKCKCDPINLGGACVTDQNKLDNKCRNLVLEPPLDMNNDNDMKRLEEKISQDMAAGGSSTVVLNVPGVGQLKYRVDTTGKIYDVSGAISRDKVPGQYDERGRQVTTMDSPISLDPQTGKYRLSPDEREHFLALIKQDAEFWKDKNAEDINYISTTSGAGANSNLSCELRRNYVRYAYGGRAGVGICVYKTASIRPNSVTSIGVSPLSGFSKSMPQRPQAAGCNKHNDGASADNAYACINSNCGTAVGGKGSGGGEVYCPICSGGSKNGDNGGDGAVSGGGSFTRGQTGVLQYQEDGAYVITENGVAAPGGTVDTIIEGTKKTPGIYNFRYIWYMPFITKHLLFGTAGNSGEELITTVTLSEDQTLETIPGKGAEKTNYKSGNNGETGGDSLITKVETNSPQQDINDFKADYVAHGGKGGTGSQKTDEYVLCHISDIQDLSPDLPCYSGDRKKTHYYKNGKFEGIQAIEPKVPERGQTVKMSNELKSGNPGMGAMGFGTESVNDFVCEERRVEKWDQVNSNLDGDDKIPLNAKSNVIRSSGIKSDGSVYDNCVGNSRIRYILPNAKDYASSTGAVIVIW